MPRFPIRPVIPVLSEAVALQGHPSRPVPLPDAPETVAAAQFGAWLNSSSAAQILATAGMAPAASADSIQKAFWTGLGPGKAAAVGDWPDFRDVYDGFPIIPPQDFVAGAISDVLQGKAKLADALALAEQRMNAAVLQ